MCKYFNVEQQVVLANVINDILTTRPSFSKYDVFVEFRKQYSDIGRYKDITNQAKRDIELMVEQTAQERGIEISGMFDQYNGSLCYVWEVVCSECEDCDDDCCQNYDNHQNSRDQHYCPKHDDCDLSDNDQYYDYNNLIKTNESREINITSRGTFIIPAEYVQLISKSNTVQLYLYNIPETPYGYLTTEHEINNVNYMNTFNIHADNRVVIGGTELNYTCDKIEITGYNINKLYIKQK